MSWKEWLKLTDSWLLLLEVLFIILVIAVGVVYIPIRGCSG